MLTSTNGAQSGGIKKPSGTKLPSGYAHTRILVKPYIKCHTFLKSRFGQPLVVFRSINSPTDQILPPFSTSVRINDFLHEVLYHFNQLFSHGSQSVLN